MSSTSEADFLRAMARHYCWDMAADDAVERSDKVLHRVMDLGLLDDIIAMEDLYGRPRLADILKRAPAGAMRPRSWWFWHYRLGLADARNDPPPMPIRVVAS